MKKLTATKIRNLKEAGNYGDGDGLTLILTGPMKGRWRLRTNINGRRRDIGLGSLGLVSLAEARESAYLIRKDIQNGLDPIAERKKAKLVIPTFRSAAKQVHAERRVAWKSGKHQKQWMTTLEKHVFPKIGDRLVNDIEGPIIRDLLAPIWLTKPETARRVKQRIGVVLDCAYANGFRASEAPLRSVGRGLPKQPKKDNRFAAVPYEDVPEFLKYLRTKDNVSRLALEFLILTARCQSGAGLAPRTASVKTLYYASRGNSWFASATVHYNSARQLGGVQKQNDLAFYVPTNSDTYQENCRHSSSKIHSAS